MRLLLLPPHPQRAELRGELHKREAHRAVGVAAHSDVHQLAAIPEETRQLRLGAALADVADVYLLRVGE